MMGSDLFSGVESACKTSVKLAVRAARFCKYGSPCFLNFPGFAAFLRSALNAVFLTVVLISSFSLKAEDQSSPSSRGPEDLTKNDDPAIAKPAQKPRDPPGPVADTVLSPLGGYGTAPQPDTGTYDAPDFSPITRLKQQLPRWIQFGLYER